jgi:DNA-binding transcriptional ArsR family regulator
MGLDVGGAAEPAVRRLSLARGLLALRRARPRFLPGIHFADPAWDMLLDLYIAERSGSRVSVSSLCLAADVPQTTALRWIKLLTERGLLERRHDDADRRRINVALTAAAITALEACLDLGASYILPG